MLEHNPEENPQTVDALTPEQRTIYQTIEESLRETVEAASEPYAPPTSDYQFLHNGRVVFEGTARSISASGTIRGGNIPSDYQPTDAPRATWANEATTNDNRGEFDTVGRGISANIILGAEARQTTDSDSEAAVRQNFHWPERVHENYVAHITMVDGQTFFTNFAFSYMESVEEQLTASRRKQAIQSLVADILDVPHMEYTPYKPEAITPAILVLNTRNIVSFSVYSPEDYRRKFETRNEFQSTAPPTTSM